MYNVQYTIYNIYNGCGELGYKCHSVMFRQTIPINSNIQVIPTIQLLSATQFNVPRRQDSLRCRAMKRVAVLMLN